MFLLRKSVSAVILFPPGWCRMEDHGHFCKLLRAHKCFFLDPTLQSFMTYTNYQGCICDVYFWYSKKEIRVVFFRGERPCFIYSLAIGWFRKKKSNCIHFCGWRCIENHHLLTCIWWDIYLHGFLESPVSAHHRKSPIPGTMPPSKNFRCVWKPYQCSIPGSLKQKKLDLFVSTCCNISECFVDIVSAVHWIWRLWLNFILTYGEGESPLSM